MKKFIGVSVIAIVVFVSCFTKGEENQFMSDETFADEAPGSCPYLTKDLEGNVVLSWIRHSDTAMNIFCFAISKDNGSRFEKAIEIPGSNNVNPHGENMPKIIFKPDGQMIAAWGAANPNPNNKYSGLVYYSQSSDEGKTWDIPRCITNDTSSYDQRYFDLALLPNGEVAMVWLDNRKGWDREGSGLYYAVTNGRRGFEEERLISGPSCQCCRTDIFLDRENRVHVLYRGIINDRIRDMVHIVSIDSGKSFSKPLRISEDDWVIRGCPHTGPAMTENQYGLHFTWFTGGGSPGIYYANSTNSGGTFSERTEVSGQASKHCQITSLDNEELVIVWNESFVRSNGGYNNRIGVEHRSTTGDVISSNYVTSPNMDASYPVILPVSGKKAVIAYTVKKGKEERVGVKTIFKGQ